MNDNYNEYMVIDGELEHVGNTVADMTGYLNENDIATDEEVDAEIEDVGEIYPRAFHVNRNLLRNWYFKKPVNQLGQTLITPTALVTNHLICDSWGVASYPGSTIELTDEGLKVSSPVSTTVAISQFFDDIPDEGVYTISVLTVSGGLFFETVVFTPGRRITSSSFIDDRNNFYIVLTGDETRPRFRIFTEKNSEDHIVAVKIEEGTEQTLAYKDPLGKWQLYETPDYDLELMKCMQWLYVQNGPSHNAFGRIESNTTDITAIFVVPAIMKGTLTITIPKVKICYEGGYIDIDNVSADCRISGSTVVSTFSIGSTSLSRQTPVTIYMSQGFKVMSS